MAPVPAAERHRKWREKLKASGSYEAYKAKNAEYSNNYHLKKKIALKNLKKEDKSFVLEDEREKARKRQQKSRDNRRSKLIATPPTKSGYSSNQGLSHSTNRIKKVFPASPGKKREVIQNLSKQFNILKEETPYCQSWLDQLAREIIQCAPPPFLLGGWTSYQIFKKVGGVEWTSNLRGGGWKRGG